MNPISLDFELNIQKAHETKSGKWIVEGLAATTDFDLQNDIISQKAIEESARDLIVNSTVLYNHDVNQPIGKIIDSRAVKGGLWIKVFISKTVADTWEKIKEGVICKFSIRGKILNAKKKWVAALKQWVQVVLKMHLVEVSMVTVPANPQAKALRWYIQKSFEQFYDQGNDLDIIKEGGEDMKFNIEDCLDEILSANGESVEKSDSSEVKKVGAVMELIDSLIAEEKDEDKKKKLKELRNVLSNYKPSESGDSSDGESYPEPKGKVAKEDDVDYSELKQSTDPEVMDMIKEALQKIRKGDDGDNGSDSDEDANKKVDADTNANIGQVAKEDEIAEEKPADGISKKESHLNSVVTKLNEAILMIKDLLTKTSDVKVEKILEKFETVKNLIGDKSDENKKDGFDSFEKLAEIQLKMAQKSQDSDEKIENLSSMITTLFKGVGAVRNEDGTISLGKEAIKGLDHRKDDNKSDNQEIETVKSSDQYSQSDIQGKREMLTKTIGAILERRKQ